MRMRVLEKGTDGVPVHTTEVFFAVVSAVELLVADVALERLLLAVNSFVARVEVTPVGGVGTVRTGVALLAAGRMLVFGLDAVLEVKQKLGHLLQDGVFPPQRTVRVLFVVLARQMHTDATRPRAVVVAARTLEHTQVGVRPQPVFSDPGQEPHAATVKAPKKLSKQHT